MFFKRLLVRAIYATIYILFAFVATGAVVLLQSKTHVFSVANNPEPNIDTNTPFPVSVNAYTQVIKEDPVVNQYFYDALAQAPTSKDRWWNKVAAVFSAHDWYQNMASPVSRILVIWPGERKEEITKHIGDILGWDETARTEFQQLTDTTAPVMVDGKYFPSQYVAQSDATPADVHELISSTFKTSILDRYTPAVAAQVPLEQTLIIASLLEREASDFDNMREISGVIWNRLFINMPLQLDATLQYVKGGNVNEKKWWPIVKPDDKYLKSAYNTYKNNGLPPAPISNPSTEAILAALNPIFTDCLFYFHTNEGTYYCSATYEEHVTKLKSVYGRGK